MILRAALVAAAVLLPALAAAGDNQVRYTSKVVAVDEKANALVFSDRSQTVVDKSIPISRDQIGKTVEVGQNGDEDGHHPATSVRVLN